MSNKAALRDQRIKIMTAVLAWEGEIGNARVRDLFDLQPVQASRLLSEFKQSMDGKIRIDGRGKAIKPAAPGSVISEETLTEYLRMTLQQGVQSPCFVDARADLTDISPAVFAALRKAALTKTGVSISYASMSNPVPSERLIFPHSIIHVGRRWHVRAWCSSRNDFRDFTLGRISSAITVQEKAPKTMEDDSLWNSFVKIELISHRKLSAGQKQVVQNEYFRGELSRCVEARECLAQYVIQDLRAAVRPEQDLPPDFQFEVANAQELSEFLFQGLQN